MGDATLVKPTVLTKQLSLTLSEVRTHRQLQIFCSRRQPQLFSHISNQPTRYRSSSLNTTTSQWAPLKTVPRLCASVPSLLTLRPRPPPAQSSSTTSLATSGSSCSPTLRTTPRSAPPSWVPSRSSSPSSPSATSSSSV